MHWWRVEVPRPTTRQAALNRCTTRARTVLDNCLDVKNVAAPALDVCIFAGAGALGILVWVRVVRLRFGDVRQFPGEGKT